MRTLKHRERLNSFPESCHWGLNLNRLATECVLKHFTLWPWKAQQSPRAMGCLEEEEQHKPLSLLVWLGGIWIQEQMWGQWFATLAAMKATRKCLRPSDALAHLQSWIQFPLTHLTAAEDDRPQSHEEDRAWALIFLLTFPGDSDNHQNLRTTGLGYSSESHILKGLGVLLCNSATIIWGLSCIWIWCIPCLWDAESRKGQRKKGRPWWAQVGAENTKLLPLPKLQALSLRVPRPGRDRGFANTWEAS